MSYNILGYLIAQRLEFFLKIAILMLNVRDCVREVLFMVEKLFDICFLFMRLNEIFTTYAICEAIRG
jgi:hypothetical protein